MILGHSLSRSRTPLHNIKLSWRRGEFPLYRAMSPSLNAQEAEFYAGINLQEILYGESGLAAHVFCCMVSAVCCQVS